MTKILKPGMLKPYDTGKPRPISFKNKIELSKKKTIYKIINYGNSRSVFVAGQTWECPKNGSILTEDKEVADGFEAMFAIDIEVI